MLYKIADIKNTLRFHNWWYAKLPPLFGIAYLLIFNESLSFTDVLPILCLLLIWMIGAAGFGYYLNNWADIDQDRLAGKPNRVADHSLQKRILILIVLLIVTFLPWIGYWLFLSIAGSPALHGFPVQFTILLACFHLILFALYSIPPFRFKERGVTGILLDALYGHVLPAAIVISCFVPDSYLLVISLVAWQFFWGVRGVLIHQIFDFENDTRSRTHTMAIQMDIAKLKTFVLFCVTLFEILAFLVCCSVIGQMNLWFWIIFLAGILLKILLKDNLALPNPEESKSLRFTRNILDNFYTEWFPIILLFNLVIFIDESHLFLLIIHLAFFAYPLAREIRQKLS
jgi:4-hydroxybenzoate polyprenyltransferase